MRIVVANDHRGVGAKERVKALLTGLGHDVQDLGAAGPGSVDYPEYAILVAGGAHQDPPVRLPARHRLGMCIAANKVHGARAANCRDIVDAELSRRHNDANVMCLAADLVGDDLMERMVRAWLDTPFEGGRHARRLDKIAKYEDAHGR